MAVNMKELCDWKNTKGALRRLEEVLSCQKCNKINEQPVCFEICGHFFCKECIKQQKDLCPICGVPARTTEIAPDHLVANLVSGWKKICNYVGYETEISENTELPHTEIQTRDKKEERSKKVSKKSVDTTAQESKKNSDPCFTTKCGTKKTPAKDKRNAKGETPLHVACIKGRIDEVKSLLEENANPNAKDNAGWTPLHEAVNGGHVEIAELLLNRGAMVNMPGGGNESPLHDAVLCNKTEAAKLLIRYGANLEARNARGKTPSYYIKSKEMMTVFKETVPDKPVASVCPEPTTPIISSDKAVIMGVGLSHEQSYQLSTLARMLKVKVVNRYMKEVTHVIVQTDDANVCSPSYATLCAILQGRWLVNTFWLTLSMEMCQLVDPAMFEVKGTTNFPDSGAPEKGRINAAKQLPGLLNGCHFYVPGIGTKYKLGNTTLSKDDLMNLIDIGDGVVLTREPDPENIPKEEQTVPYHVEQDSILAKCSHFIIYKPGKEEPKLQYKMAHIKSLSAQWLLDCMETFHIWEPITQNT